MIIQEVERVRQQLGRVGHVLTSFEALGVRDEYTAASNELAAAIRETDQFRDTAVLGRTGMLMFREDAPLSVGRKMAKPVVETLFFDTPDAISQMGLYAINHYETGDFFNPHQDHFDGTVLIMTPQGRRRLDIYKKEVEDDVFEDVTHSYELNVGSIMVLNGLYNLGHSAVCLEGPSISVVADVPMVVTDAPIRGGVYD